MRLSISHLFQPALIFNSSSGDGLETGFAVDKSVLLILHVHVILSYRML